MWGYIDKKSNIVIDLLFDNAREFSEGLAPVQIGKKWGYINKSGEFVIKPKFSNAWSFDDKLAFVEENVLGVKFDCYINKLGKKICR